MIRTNMIGIKRDVAAKIYFLLENFPAVAILGARQVGKTTLAKQVAPHWRYFDLEKPSHFDQITHDTEFFFQQYPNQLIIDEVQSYPDLFKILRGVIDERPKENGRFIITGSSSPDILHQASESLAGRIAIVELGTLKVNEFYEKPLSSFYEIFQNKLDRNVLNFATPPFSLEEIQNVWLKGGYPQPLLSASEDYYFQWMENYQATYINRDIAALFPKLNKVSYQRFLAILNKLSITIINPSYF